jgi:biopolymer transport protein ExbD
MAEQEATIADPTSVRKPKRRWFQYRLRTLLALAVLGAVAFPWLARWTNRPRAGTISVKLTAKGDVLFGGEPIGPDRLQPVLAREANVLKDYGWAPHLVIEADARAKTGDVQRLVKAAQKAGIEKFSLRPAKSSMPQE